VRLAEDLGGTLPADLLAEIDGEIDQHGAAAPGLVYGRRLEACRQRRRADGAYYTPPHLVDFVLERTLGPALPAAADDVHRVRVLDPACGAGAFLAAALAFIAERYRAQVPATAWPAFVEKVAGVCLTGVDFDATAVDLCRLAVAIAARRLGSRGATSPRLLVGNALFDLAGLPTGNFDAVIGNPPWGQKGFRFTAGDKATIRKSFRAGRGAIDPYALFVERALTWARPGGRWGMVLPDILLLKDQQDIRDLILERCAVEWIVDAGRAFAGVALDAIVVVARCQPPAGADHSVSIWRELPAPWRTRPPPTARRRQTVFTELPGHQLNIRIDDAALALWRKLAPLPRLGEVFAAHEGVHSGNARAKLFLSAPRDARSTRLVVGGREVERYLVAWAGAWLDRAPDALDRAAGDYANLGRREWHERAKLVVRRTGDRVVAAFDPAGLVFSNNLFVLCECRPLSAAELQAYVAFLNSRFTTWYFRTVQPRTGRLFAELKIKHLVEFPLPPPDRWAAAVPRLAELAARLADLTRQRRAAPPATSAAGARARDLDREREREEERAGAEQAVDEETLALFALTPTERGLVLTAGAAGQQLSPPPPGEVP
jgi:predicted RNA methylase